MRVNKSARGSQQNNKQQSQQQKQHQQQQQQKQQMKMAEDKEKEEGELTADDEENVAPASTTTSYDRMDIDLPTPKMNANNNNVSENKASRSQVRLQVQDAIKALYAYNIKYEDLVNEGLDKMLLQRLYQGVGIEVATGEDKETFREPAAFSGNMQTSPTSKIAATAISKPTTTTTTTTTVAAEKTIMPSIEPTTTTTTADANKPMERKDVIARMLAMKAKKSTSSPEEPTKSSSPSAATTTIKDNTNAPAQTQQEQSTEKSSPTPSKQTKESKSKEVNKAQTELAKQRIEQLRLKALMSKGASANAGAGAATTAASADSTAASTPTTEKAEQAPVPASSLPLVEGSRELPMRPASRVRETPAESPAPTTAPVATTGVSQIPGLFMTAPPPPAPAPATQPQSQASLQTSTAQMESSAPDTSLPPKPPTAMPPPLSIQKLIATQPPASDAVTPAPATTVSVLTPSTTASLPEPLPSLTPASTTQQQITRKRPRAADFNDSLSESRGSKRSVGFSPHMNYPAYDPRVIIDISDDDEADGEVEGGSGLDYGDGDVSASWNGRAGYGKSPYSDWNGNGNNAVTGMSTRSSPMPGVQSSTSAKSAKPAETHMRELMELKKKIAELEEKKRRKKEAQQQLAATSTTMTAAATTATTATTSGESTPVTGERSGKVSPVGGENVQVETTPAPPASSEAVSPSVPAMEVDTTTSPAPSSPSSTTASAPAGTATDDYRTNILRKRVSLSALKARIAENERKREEMRKQEEALAAELERERERQEGLMRELEGLVSAEAAAAEAAKAAEVEEARKREEEERKKEEEEKKAAEAARMEEEEQIAKEEREKEKGELHELTKGFRSRADISLVPEEEVPEPVEEPPVLENKELPSEQHEAPSTVDSSAIEDLIRETRPAEEEEAASTEKETNKPDLDDEPMEESSPEGSVVMGQSPDVQAPESQPENGFEREGSYSPPEDVQEINASTVEEVPEHVTESVETAPAVEEKAEEQPEQAVPEIEAVPSPARVDSEDVEMHEVSSDSEEYQPAESHPPSGDIDIEMQDGDAASQSDGYEPADIVPEAEASHEVENDHYEPPEPEAVAQNLPEVSVQEQQQEQQEPLPSEAMELDDKRVSFDELTWTQQSIPTPPPVAEAVADEQVCITLPHDYDHEPVRQVNRETPQKSETEPTTTTTTTTTTTSTYKPKYYTEYVTPLRYFRSYRYHADYLKNVAGGFRSLTYSNQINTNKELCAFELSGGVCNDKTCGYQHLADLALSGACGSLT